MDDPPRIDELEWDDWNLEHIQKHSVTVAEVADMIRGEATFQASYKNRILVIAPTSAGRMLSVTIGESPYQPYRWYVFSARPASRVERRAYMAAKGLGNT